jgi:phosphoribosyl 1,2-cyclic phosphodiesterase
MIELTVLGSGSRGNATLVRTERSAVLIDIGFSTRELCRRLEAVGHDPQQIEAIVLTHEHGDHIAGLATFTRRFGLPVYGNGATLAALDKELAHATCITEFETGVPFEIGEFCIDPFPIPHDAVDPVGFVLHAQGLRVGYATDLGHVTGLIAERLRGCSAIVFESNHDRQMLLDGPYPWVTKQRVASRYGHLSNEHAAEALPVLAADSAELVLAHLSETNNQPALCRAVVESALRSHGLGLNVHVAEQHRPSHWVRI